MAILKTGELVAGIRGTVGGITYSANSSGPYAKIWSRGTNPRSPRQGRTRGNMSGFGPLWASMDDTGRDNWRAFAEAPPELDSNSLGEPIELSGWMWFVRANQRRQSVGLEPTTSVPSTTPLIPFSTASIYALAGPYGTVICYWPNAELGAGMSITIDMGAHTTTGLLAKTSGLFQVLAYHEPTGGGTTVALRFWEQWGYPAIGWKIYGNFYRLRDDGVRSGPLATSIEVE